MHRCVTNWKPTCWEQGNLHVHMTQHASARMCRWGQRQWKSRHRLAMGQCTADPVTGQNRRIIRAATPAMRCSLNCMCPSIQVAAPGFTCYTCIHTCSDHAQCTMSWLISCHSPLGTPTHVQRCGRRTGAGAGDSTTPKALHSAKRRASSPS
jgi:hypothetical protein